MKKVSVACVLNFCVWIYFGVHCCKRKQNLEWPLFLASDMACHFVICECSEDLNKCPHMIGQHKQNKNDKTWDNWIQQNGSGIQLYKYIQLAIRLLIEFKQHGYNKNNCIVCVTLESQTFPAYPQTIYTKFFIPYEVIRLSSVFTVWNFY